MTKKKASILLFVIGLGFCIGVFADSSALYWRNRSWWDAQRVYGTTPLTEIDGPRFGKPSAKNWEALGRQHVFYGRGSKAAPSGNVVLVHALKRPLFLVGIACWISAFVLLGWGWGWSTPTRSVQQVPEGEFDPTIAACTEAIWRGGRDPGFDVYCNRGHAYLNNGDYESAIADLTKALQLNPECIEAYYNRGVAYNENGDFESAIADYTQAIRLDPEDSEAYFNRGIAYRQLENQVQADVDFHRATELRNTS